MEVTLRGHWGQMTSYQMHPSGVTIRNVDMHISVVTVVGRTGCLGGWGLKPIGAPEQRGAILPSAHVEHHAADELQ